MQPSVEGAGPPGSSDPITEQLRRSKAVRVIFSVADARKIKQQQECLATAVSHFEVSPLKFVLYLLRSG